MFARRDQVNTALANTYQWVSGNSMYKNWYSTEGIDKSSILWIQGKPGSGKSTLAKLIRKSLGPISDNLVQNVSKIEIYSESDTTNATATGPKSYDGSSLDIVAGSFFSSRSGVTSRSPKWMLQALLYQILAQNPKLYEEFRETFHSVRSGENTWSYDTLKSIFVGLCRPASQKRVYVSPRYYVVIDAFDESESNGNIDRTDFLELLSSLCSGSQGGSKSACILKVLLVSRPASDIESRLRSFNSIEMHKQTVLDIEKIVTSGLDSILQSLKTPRTGQARYLRARNIVVMKTSTRVLFSRTSTERISLIYPSYTNIFLNMQMELFYGLY